jgi:hypothetical protein
MNQFPTTIEELKTNREEIIETILEFTDNDINLVKPVMTQLTFLIGETMEQNGWDICEAIEEAIKTSRLDTDMSAFISIEETNKKISRNCLPSSMR